MEINYPGIRKLYAIWIQMEQKWKMYNHKCVFSALVCFLAAAN